MSHIIVRKMIENQYSYAGRKWWYEFHSLPNAFRPEFVSKYVRSLSQSYSKLTKQWNDELNSEWISRIFLAAKMVLSASVMLQSLRFAKKKNLRIVESYLEYYSILMALRAMVFTSPSVPWRNGEMIILPHATTINLAQDILSKLDKPLAKKLIADVRYIKSYRELISYRAPSSGDSFPRLKGGIDTAALSQLLVEIAQLQSEVLESSLTKNTKGNFTLKKEYIDRVCSSTIEDYEFFDDEDAYRMRYLKRHYPMPTNIRHMMSEGHVEDFFGSWQARGKSSKGTFDPDDNWSIIFDVP